jgi:hypothetical protein
VPYVAEPPGEEEANGHEGRGAVDMSDSKGQEHVKRAVEVAASGGHNWLMTGHTGYFSPPRGLILWLFVTLGEACRTT